MVTLAEAEPGAEQDRGHRVGRVYDGEGADQECQGLGRFHSERDGQEDRDGTRAAESGDEAHDQAGDGADQEHDEE